MNISVNAEIYIIMGDKIDVTYTLAAFELNLNI